MRILLTGSSGLLGTALQGDFSGDEITRLVRTASEGSALWDPASGTIDTAALEGHDAVIHLAGAGIADRRWSKKYKALVWDSRTKGTTLLCESLAGLERKPKVLISSSAVGYYGNRYGEVVREYSDRGRGFLAELCEAWEAATKPARDAGIRVVNLRTGLVMSTKGGPLKKMLLPFRLCLGGRIGSGAQYMSWIAIDDMVAAVRHCIETESLEGPVNACAPNPVTNREFTNAMSNVLVRPAILPMPAIAAKLAFGEMANELLLSGQRCDPERLRQTGFRFKHTDVREALTHLLRGDDA
ncbi:MAG: TIGR01777 family oxidoreductase [Planctomycetota bacterium]|jgi:uncharacterized protein (TIGR01777 family)